MHWVRIRPALITGTALFLCGAAPADSPVSVPEPAGLWEGGLQGYTPKTLSGATVVDAAAVQALAASGEVVMLDVSEADPTPANLAPGRIWRPVHRSIPGSRWLPGAGSGTLTEAERELLAQRIRDLTGGERNRSLVTFCHPDCWGSWNAAKRLVALGYTRVHWFPEGIEGWQEGRETAETRPDTAWAGRPKAERGR